MVTVTEFLLARIAEDEEVARAATPGPWYWAEADTGDWPQGGPDLCSSGSKTRHGYNTQVVSASGYDAWSVEVLAEDQAHIARWNPARVLAEVEAKRRIVEVHRPLAHDPEPFCWNCDEETWPCKTMAALALPYSDHPDYREEWRGISQ